MRVDDMGIFTMRKISMRLLPPEYRGIDGILCFVLATALNVVSLYIVYRALLLALNLAW